MDVARFLGPACLNEKPGSVKPKLMINPHQLLSTIESALKSGDFSPGWASLFRQEVSLRMSVNAPPASKILNAF